MAQQTRLLTDDLVAFGRNLARWRKLNRLTTSMVAERAGISLPTLRDIERGTGTPRFENVMAVMRVLGVSAAVIDATEPLATDIGRARADLMLARRVTARKTAR